MATLVSYALSSVADVKESLGIDSGDSTKNNLIIRKINQATDMIESWCQLARNHHFVATTYTNEEYNGSGSDQLILAMRPVNSITSFQYRNSPENINSWTDIDTEDYFTGTSNLSSGIISNLFTQGTNYSSFRVTYNAGYTTIPSDLAEATASLAAFLVENSTSGSNVKRKREGQREVEYFETGANSGSVIEQLGLDDLLSRYINYTVLDA